MAIDFPLEIFHTESPLGQEDTTAMDHKFTLKKKFN